MIRSTDSEFFYSMCLYTEPTCTAVDMNLNQGLIPPTFLFVNLTGKKNRCGLPRVFPLKVIALCKTHCTLPKVGISCAAALYTKSEVCKSDTSTHSNLQAVAEMDVY